MNEQQDILIEALLLRYLDGECTEEERADIERDPALQQRLNATRQFDAYLHEALTPSAEELVDFAADMLEPTRALVVGRAVQSNPQLQADVASMRTLLATDPFAPPANAPSPLKTLAQGVRQVIELFHVPQAAGVRSVGRGNVLRFEGPDVTLTLRQQRGKGEDPSWRIRGRVEWSGEGQPAVVTLRSAEGKHYRTLSDAEGFFHFGQLQEGVYDLTLLLDNQQQEVHLRDFVLET